MEPLVSLLWPNGYESTWERPWLNQWGRYGPLERCNKQERRWYNQWGGRLSSDWRLLLSPRAQAEWRREDRHWKIYLNQIWHWTGEKTIEQIKSFRSRSDLSPLEQADRRREDELANLRVGNIYIKSDTGGEEKRHLKRQKALDPDQISPPLMRLPLGRPLVDTAPAITSYTWPFSF